MFDRLSALEGWEYDGRDIDGKTLDPGEKYEFFLEESEPGAVLFASGTISGAGGETVRIIFESGRQFSFDSTIAAQQQAGATERGAGWLPHVQKYDTTNDVYTVVFEAVNGYQWDDRVLIQFNAPASLPGSVNLNATLQSVRITDMEAFRRSLNAAGGGR